MKMESFKITDLLADADGDVGSARLFVWLSAYASAASQHQATASQHQASDENVASDFCKTVAAKALARFDRMLKESTS